MTGEAFQEELEAAGKWTRARLSSGQFASSYVGCTEHLAVRRDAQTRAGAGLSLRGYHDGVLNHGPPPARLVRALLFDEAIA